VMDADLQHPPETLYRLIKSISDGAELAVASRHVPGGGVSDWSLVRRAISWGATLMTTWFLPGTLSKVRDPMSGYFVVRKPALDGVHLNPEGYKILVEVLSRGHFQTVAELPYTFIERKRGGSKLGAPQYIQFVRHLAQSLRSLVMR